MAEGEQFCGNCGRDCSSAASATPPVDPAIAFGLAPETSGKAIFSLVSGLFGLFLPAALVAVIFGHLSLSEIRRSAGRLSGRGLAITGLVLGYLGVAFTVVILIIAAFSIPKALRAEKERTVTTVGSKGSSAVSVVRTMNTAEIAYAQAHRATGYTCSLSELSGTWGIRSELDRAKKNGYTIELQDCAARIPGGPVTKYRLVAYPLAVNQAGKPAYCSNEST